jgi:uncharacterized protein (DUF736 family)
MVHISFFYANDDNILDGSVHTLKKNTEVLVVVSKENGLEINANKVSTSSCLEAECRTKSQYKDC